MNKQESNSSHTIFKTLKSLSEVEKTMTSIEDITSSIGKALNGAKAIAEALGIIQSDLTKIWGKLDDIEHKIDVLEYKIDYLTILTEQLIDYVKNKENETVMNSFKEPMYKMIIEADLFYGNIWFQIKEKILTVKGWEIVVDEKDINIEKGKVKEKNVYEEFDKNCELYINDVWNAIKGSNNIVLENLHLAFFEFCMKLTNNYGHYEKTPFFVFDEWINNTYNWDREAYVYRQMFRNIILKYLNIGLISLCLIEKANKRDIQEFIKICENLKAFFTVKHGAKHPNIAETNKGEYSLVDHRFVKGVKKICGEDLFNHQKVSELILVNTVEMSRRANVLNRPLYKDLIINKVITDEESEFVKRLPLIVNPNARQDFRCPTFKIIVRKKLDNDRTEIFKVFDKGGFQPFAVGNKYPQRCNEEVFYFI